MSVNIEDNRPVAKNIGEYFTMMKESHKTLGWIWEELVSVKGKRHLKWMTVWMLASSFLFLAPSWLVGQIGDAQNIGDHILASNLIYLIGFGIGLGIITNMLMSYCRERSLGEIMGQVDRRMSELFFSKSVGQHSQEGSRLSASNVEKARGRVWSVVDMLIFGGLNSITYLVISYILLWSVSWVGGLIMTALLLHYITWMFFLNFKVMKVCTPLDKEFHAHNRYRSDRWDLVHRVLNSGKAEEEISYMSSWFRQIIEKDLRFWLWYITVSSLRALVRVGALVLVLLYVNWAIKHVKVEPSTFVPVFIWTFGIINGIWQIGHIERMVNWNMPSIQSMKEALSIESDVKVKDDPIRLSTEKPLKVELSGLTQAYPSEDGKGRLKPVLKNVSFTIEAGEKVALVGSTGAGKSTVAKLMMRDMDPTSGSVCFNGHDLHDIDLNQLRQMVGFIAQDPPVLDDTLRENILYRIPRSERGHLTDDLIMEVLKKVRLNKTERFDEGLDTRVGRNGIKLSGGEKQRLMIAAAVIQKLRFIIIDEATSSLDSRTEKQVQKELELLLGPGTSALVIAHRFSTLRNCDKIVVLKAVDEINEGQPQIEAIGRSFEELYQISPTFKELADDQGLKIETRSIRAAS